jgi:uncharacterized surface protein with fasciclin (FAS1) repeats
MKKRINVRCIGLILLMAACQSNTNEQRNKNVQAESTLNAGGQEAIVDDVSQKDIVKIAAGSKDHTTLVAALTKADYLTELSNAGPFTVFAPVNAAFENLPPGTLDDLLKPENKDKLRHILEYHVAVGGYKQEYLRDGQTINQANLKNITVQIQGGTMKINQRASVLATIPASNGIIYVINEVLLPPAD